MIKDPLHNQLNGEISIKSAILAHTQIVSVNYYKANLIKKKILKLML